MEIKCIAVGELQCNCYILEKNNECLLIDPGDEYNKIKKLITNKKVLAILITHNHFDHIGCLEDFKKEKNIPIYRYSNLKEESITIGPFSFEVLYTKGHTKDSVTFYFKKEKAMFTGDFLFFDTVGRWDFKDGNYQELLESIKKIKQYPDDIKIYPGHGPSTTLGREKKYNSFFV